MIEMVKARGFKALLLLVMASLLLINYLAWDFLMALLPDKPFDVWVYALICSIVTGCFYMFDFRGTRWDWLWFSMFVFFFGLFLIDFQDFCAVTINAINNNFSN